MVALTEREKAIYTYIMETTRRDGFSPSVRDIQNSLAIKSTSTVHSYLERLEKKGYIKKESGKSRTVRTEPVIEEVKRTLKIPVLTHLTIGSPVLASENFEGYIDFPNLNQSYLPNQLFALRVKDSELKDSGIVADDIVVVKKENHAENGDISVLLKQNKIVIKIYSDDLDSDETFVIGKIIAMMRYYG